MTFDELTIKYQNRLATYGIGPQAVQWSDHITQLSRFKILSQAVSDYSTINNILDFGCGLCDLNSYLRSNGVSSSYTGVDIVPEFIEIANMRMKHDNSANAILIQPGERINKNYDIIFISGVFNNKINDNLKFIKSTLSSLFEVTNIAISFNALSTHVDYFDDELFYVDPMELFNFCKVELGGDVLLKHDYVLKPNGFPYEFTIYLYKNIGFSL